MKLLKAKIKNLMKFCADVRAREISQVKNFITFDEFSPCSHKMTTMALFIVKKILDFSLIFLF